jgi:hypothetical protein
VEQIQESIQSQSSNSEIPFRGLPYVRFMFILVAGFSLTNFGVMAFAFSTQFMQASSNPFLEYMDIFPGQSTDAVKSRTFSCVDIHSYQVSSDQSCALTVSSSVFSHIEITISGGYIRDTTFTMRDDTFKVGNLVLLFGNPTFRVSPYNVFFSWNDLFVSVLTMTSVKPVVFRPVWTVTFVNKINKKVRQAQSLYFN